jgi:SAM-dependent methyltransferase
MNDSALSFDAVASVYDDVRPGYPDEVYATVSRHKDFSGSSRILEIGAGQGVATAEIAARWPARITALEPGTRFCELLRARFPEGGRVTVHNVSFEAFNAEERSFDGIFSATAFHWLDPAVKYAKVGRLLTDDGVLVLYWNNFGIGDAAVDVEIREVYAAHGFPPRPDRDQRDIQNEKIAARQREIDESGLFRVVGHRVIRHVIAYSSDRYVGLLKTFPDHTDGSILDPEGFFEGIAAIGRRHGDLIPVEVRVNLELARKA